MKFLAGLCPPHPNHICLLRKSLFGLKQASQQWYARFAGALNFKGYTTLLNDYSLFFKKDKHIISIIAVYVDAILINGDNLPEITAIKTFLHTKFEVKSLGNLYYFLGMEIIREKQGIIVCQRKFSMDLLCEFDVSDFSIVASPLEHSTKLHADHGPLLLNPTVYRCLVGKLNYLTHTRTNLSFHVLKLSQFMQSPRLSHYTAAIHVLRYLKNDPGQGIFFNSVHSLKLLAF